MIDVTDKLREAMNELKAEAEQTEDPEEKAAIMYEVSCIGSTLLELQNPNYRKKGYDGVSPHVYTTKKTNHIKGRRT